MSETPAPYGSARKETDREYMQRRSREIVRGESFVYDNLTHPLAQEVVQLLQERDEAQAEVERLRDDVAKAAGELLMPIPEPGTDMSRLMSANVLMRRENERLREALRKISCLIDSDPSVPAQVIRSTCAAVAGEVEE